MVTQKPFGSFVTLILVRDRFIKSQSLFYSTPPNIYQTKPSVFKAAIIV